MDEFVTRSEAETEEVGRRIASRLQPSDVVYLIGQLGSGKTCLARGIAEGLEAASREVASPSFAILHEYAGPGGRIVLRHIDLYRLEDRAGELEVLGLPDSVRGAPVVVEWPGSAIRAVLPPDLEISLEAPDEGSRRIRVGAPGSGPRPAISLGSLS